MEFYNYLEIPRLTNAKVFKTSVRYNMVGVVIISLIIIGFLALGLNGGFQVQTNHFSAFLCYWIAGSMLLLALFTFPASVGTFDPSNWLMQFNQELMAIKYRSYLNRDFDSKDIQVFSLTPDEIEWVRKVREKESNPMGSDSITVRYLEIKLKNADTGVLEEYLRQEREKKNLSPDESQNEYFKYSSKYLDYPVTVVSPGLIRLRWDGISPGLKIALEILGASVPILEETSMRADYFQMDGLSAEEKKTRIISLVQQGKVITAIHVAKYAFNMDTTQAKQWVDVLDKNTSS